MNKRLAHPLLTRRSGYPSICFCHNKLRERGRGGLRKEEKEREADEAKLQERDGDGEGARGVRRGGRRCLILLCWGIYCALTSSCAQLEVRDTGVSGQLMAKPPLIKCNAKRKRCLGQQTGEKKEEARAKMHLLPAEN